MRQGLGHSLVALFLVVALGPRNLNAVTPANFGSCESLVSAALPRARITRAQLVAADQSASAGLLPDFCRVAATLTPSPDSDISIEVWMPAAGWNGRFEALGNGGWGGSLPVQQLGVTLARGSAVAMTDTGHSGQGGRFAFNHPEKLADFGYRAVHEMTVQAKALIQAYYGKAPSASYWNGCSTGGRQGLKEAQRYPADYDGIIAGDPTNDMTHMLTANIWMARTTLASSSSYITKDKYAVLHRAVIDACDTLDGIKDGVLDDPRRCTFDPQTIQCRGDDATSCLTAEQVGTVRALYAPVRNARTGAEIFPGLERGSELGWANLTEGARPMSIPDDYFKFVVFKNPAWDFRTLDFDRDVAKAEAVDQGDMDATDPDVRAFVNRGGKLLLYHGWSDPLVAPQNTINYYANVMRALGGAGTSADAVRLFMAPGMAHCGGGEGPGNFDGIGVLERWVEQHQPPDRIVATHLTTTGVVDRTRPLCPYPQVAVYLGTGDTDDASSFVCRVSDPRLRMNSGTMTAANDLFLTLERFQPLQWLRRLVRVTTTGGHDMRARIISLLIPFGSLLIPFGVCVVLAESPQTQSPPMTMDMRGSQAMGFDQDKTTHHFYLYRDGGAIDVSANDPQDAVSADAIRSHLPHIAMMFADGDFSTPMLVHAKDVPGTAELTRLKAKVMYRYEKTDRGGRVNITTTDPDALKALYRFLRFQIADHRTGDSPDVRPR